jgi:hypothetical protein
VVIPFGSWIGIGPAREGEKEGRKEDEANNYNRRSLERGKREINLGS